MKSLLKYIVIVMTACPVQGSITGYEVLVFSDTGVYERICACLDRVSQLLAGIYSLAQ